MVCLTRPALAPSHHERRSGRRRDRTNVADDASRRDALVDPLDGCGNWLFSHHDPPNVDGVRLAAAPQRTNVPEPRGAGLPPSINTNPTVHGEIWLSIIGPKSNDTWHHSAMGE